MKKNNSDKPLEVSIKNDVLSISLGIDTLKWAAEHHPELWLPNTDKFAMVVSDSRLFAKEVRRALQHEEEDGTTPVHVLLDQAILSAIENGAEGMDIDAMEALEEEDRKHEEDF